MSSGEGMVVGSSQRMFVHPPDLILAEQDPDLGSQGSPRHQAAAKVSDHSREVQGFVQ